jgi:hypothetical protein
LIKSTIQLTSAYTRICHQQSTHLTNKSNLDEPFAKPYGRFVLKAYSLIAFTYC